MKTLTFLAFMAVVCLNGVAHCEDNDRFSPVGLIRDEIQQDRQNSLNNIGQNAVYNSVQSQNRPMDTFIQTNTATPVVNSTSCNDRIGVQLIQPDGSLSSSEYGRKNWYRE
ncbi:MAG: hypothetical protein RBU23_12585 [Candidatus Auribacterota bacterium]|jgi:hypothetical protein|nr:hypothetical protein [Candidatus Auribacterota bacterium]